MSATREPAEYPRRILLAVTGLSPQIITETLYALVMQAKPTFVPTEIHIITTEEGAKRVRRTLLDAREGHFHALCKDYNLQHIHFDESCLHIIGSTQGSPLTDIRTPEENALAADSLLETVRQFTADQDSALHVSIAGGRKTMGFYLGYCLSLLARPQDRLSHVLVSDPFESHPQFFYPPAEARVLDTRDNRSILTSNAQITLADIPFVRMRDGLPEALLQKHARFSQVVAAAQSAGKKIELVINIATHTATASGEKLKLSTQNFTLLLWLAQRQQAGKEPIHCSTKTGGNQSAATEYLTLCRQLYDKHSSELEAIETSLKNGMETAWFSPAKTRLHKILVQALGENGAAPYQIYSIGKRRDARFALTLKPDYIHIF